VQLSGGRAQYFGVQSCGSAWACPYCTQRHLQEKAREIVEGLRFLHSTPIHWGEGPADARSCPVDGSGRATAGSAYLLTLTIPHCRADALKVLVRRLTDGYGRLFRGAAAASDRERYRLLGHIRCLDITYGNAGWHPHIHAVICLGGTLSANDLTRLRRRLYVRWARSIAGKRPRAGKRFAAWTERAPSYRHGIQLELVRDLRQVAHYVAHLANTVGDTRGPRVRPATDQRACVHIQAPAYENPAHAHEANGSGISGRTPWDILRDAAAAPPCDENGVVNDERERDLALWHEYEAATLNQQPVHWSRGLKALLHVTDQPTTSRSASATIHTFTCEEWWALCDTQGAPAVVLFLAETGGAEAVRTYLAGIIPGWQARRARSYRGGGAARVLRLRH